MSQSSSLGFCSISSVTAMNSSAAWTWAVTDEGATKRIETAIQRILDDT